MNNNGALLKSTNMFQMPFSLNSPTLLHSNNKTHHQHSFISIQLPKHKLLSFHLKSPSGSPLFASKTPIKAEPTTPATEEFDLEDEFEDEYEDDDDEDEDEDEDEEIIVPLRNMRQWTRNKPLGFGEGKVYDTSVEDKLLEELEQSRVAQIANVNNLKNNPEDGNPKKEKLPKQKVPELPSNGIRVRLVNLPKKKNIHRDLQVAFKPFSGIVNIIPAVLGNEKTREPVCKGFAFVDFKSEKEANRFVDMFSTQPITFGKVQKHVRCEIMKPNSPNLAPAKPTVRLPVSNPTATINSTIVAETPFDPYVEDAALDKFKNGDDRLVSATDHYNDSEYAKIDNVVQEKHEPEAGSEPLKKQKKVSVKGKKMIAGKKKAENTPKLNIPGSANRLKMKEKALLSGVFSKYGAMATKGTEVDTD